MTTIMDAAFDAAIRASRFVELVNTRASLVRDIAAAQTTCGGCRLWMTRDCPQETRDGWIGRRRGPHMNTSKCGRFVMNAVTTRLVEEWRESITRIDAELAPGWRG